MTRLIQPDTNKHKLTNKKSSISDIDQKNSTTQRRYFIEGPLTESKDFNSGGLNMDDYLTKLKHMTETATNAPTLGPSSMKEFTRPEVESPVVSPDIEIPKGNLVTKISTNGYETRSSNQLHPNMYQPSSSMFRPPLNSLNVMRIPSNIQQKQFTSNEIRSSNQLNSNMYPSMVRPPLNPSTFMRRPFNIQQGQFTNNEMKPVEPSIRSPLEVSNFRGKSSQPFHYPTPLAHPQAPSNEKVVGRHFVGGAGIPPLSYGEAGMFPLPWQQHNYDDDKIKALGFHYGADESNHHESVNLGKIPSWSKCGMEHPCINYGRVAPVKDPKMIDMTMKSGSFDTPPLEQFHVGFDHHYEGEHFVDLDHVLSSTDEIAHYVHDHDLDHDKHADKEESETDDDSAKKGYAIKNHWTDPILDIARNV